MLVAMLIITMGVGQGINVNTDLRFASMDDCYAAAQLVTNRYSVVYCLPGVTK